MENAQKIIIVVIVFYLIKPCLTQNKSYNDIHTYNCGDYNITIINNERTFNTAIIQRLINLYSSLYPKLVDRFNRNAPKSVTVRLDPTRKSSFIAVAYGNTINISTKTIRYQYRYYDILLHELMHVVQDYPATPEAKWLGEGIADYARYTYAKGNADTDWSLPDYSPTQQYNDSYGVTARFLVWLENRYNSTIIEELDVSLRTNTYTPAIWLNLTGNTVDQLWTNYSKYPILITDLSSALKMDTSYVVDR
ncbi:unnamed protein product [Didymodactylos carnosus]|uniref:Secretory protein n=1 Tax=Didymodactylos carnosus TaxID=1234261 RepID=A0A815CE32_9BILA|nr:unnamed protein product [Didymodactylos carnosus]CAF1373049.1 unnamed protein product [Didymodactylos carnosus]CAF4086607.1 unnamed protein product [Didymodactylos carnosus]CAF4181905.1 unnamed protein product [Didymodactylos carnosus]